MSCGDSLNPPAAAVRIFQQVPQADKFPPANSLNSLPEMGGIPSVTTTDWVVEDKGCPPAAAGRIGGRPPLLDSEGSTGRIEMPTEEMTIAYSGCPAGATNVDNTHLLTHKHLPLAPTSEPHHYPGQNHATGQACLNLTTGLACLNLTTGIACLNHLIPLIGAAEASEPSTWTTQAPPLLWVSLPRGKTAVQSPTCRSTGVGFNSAGRYQYFLRRYIVSCFLAILLNIPIF